VRRNAKRLALARKAWEEQDFSTATAEFGAMAEEAAEAEAPEEATELAAQAAEAAVADEDDDNAWDWAKKALKWGAVAAGTAGVAAGVYGVVQYFRNKGDDDKADELEDEAEDVLGEVEPDDDDGEGEGEE